MFTPRSIPGPVLEIDVFRARRNIKRMVEKAQRSGVVLRPHFKTHQSLEVAEWFCEEGVESCTVSSPTMAEFFANGGWDDILIAFPAQPGAMDIYRKLSSTVKLGLITDSPDVVNMLAEGLESEVDVWIEIDAGYARTGVAWDDQESLKRLASVVESAACLNLRGVLTHGGDTYTCRNSDEIVQSYQRCSERMLHASDILSAVINRKVDISCGDTPSCSVVEDFSSMTEIRPGNFVFYDLMQYQIGACELDDIALRLACPIAGIYPTRGEIVIHGGAVHLSKERLQEHEYGRVLVTDSDGHQQVLPNVVVKSLSQEHGLVSAPSNCLEGLEIGDVLHVLPVHSCLTMDCMLPPISSSVQSLCFIGK
ncbi:alanine racemase [Oceaniferula spumae]|uniref:Alanine racemase n=1 Tax=Oceaniferula spumae TaxID=2979115 RepID=A0AAT9FJL9_9BACT